MKIVIAPDSFKESLNAFEVANAIEKGFKHIFPDATYVKVPMADGGEGMVQALIDATQGKLMEMEVTAPLGNPIIASFGISGDGKTAMIEMAAASGLALVPKEQRNPLLTTTYGTGELIRAALNHGVEKIILGIGGSATNDGGVGMLQALGAQFLDANNQPIAMGGAALAHLARVDYSNLDARLHNVHFEVACDVDNPLYGTHGASAVFGSQKGATPQMIQTLDYALQHYAHIVQRDLGKDIAHVAGAGAAGGMGAALLTLPNVELKAGVQIVIETVNLAQSVADADWVITGEGRMDAQSIRGKTPIGVARIAKQFGKPVVAIVGCLGEDYEIVFNHGIDAVFPIISRLGSLEDTLAHAEYNLISTAQNVARLQQLSRK